MKSNRIERIRELGDQLAAYVHEENDTAFFRTFYAGNEDVIRNKLIRVSQERVKRGQPPLVRFQPYLEVFEEVDENGKTNWRLARDLVLIRMIERLYEMKWIEQHPEAVPEDVAEEETTD